MPGDDSTTIRRWLAASQVCPPSDRQDGGVRGKFRGRTAGRATPRYDTCGPHRPTNHPPQAPVSLKPWTADDNGAGAAGYGRDHSPRVEDPSSSERQQYPQSPLASRQPQPDCDRGGQVREHHDQVPSTHQRHPRTMRYRGLRVVRHQVRAARRRGRHSAARARHSCRGRSGSAAEQLQGRVQHPLPAGQQRDRPSRAYGRAREWGRHEHCEHEQRNKQRRGGRDTTGRRVAREATGEQHQRECQYARPARHRVTRHNQIHPRTQANLAANRRTNAPCTELETVDAVISCRPDQAATARIGASWLRLGRWGSRLAPERLAQQSCRQHSPAVRQPPAIGRSGAARRTMAARQQGRRRWPRRSGQPTDGPAS